VGHYRKVFPSEDRWVAARGFGASGSSHSHTHSLTYSHIHPPTHRFTHSLTQSLTDSLTHTPGASGLRFSDWGNPNHQTEEFRAGD
jgi:hypothetical protein